MNKITLIGNLVRDPEVGTTQSGVGYCRFTIAVRRRYQRNGQDADFIRVIAWRGLGDSCAQYLKKGRKVAVVGAADVNARTGRDGQARAEMEVTADDVEFLSPRDADAPADAPAPAAAPPAQESAQPIPVDAGEDLPF